MVLSSELVIVALIASVLFPIILLVLLGSIGSGLQDVASAIRAQTQAHKDTAAAQDAAAGITWTPAE